MHTRKIFTLKYISAKTGKPTEYEVETRYFTDDQAIAFLEQKLSDSKKAFPTHDFQARIEFTREYVVHAVLRRRDDSVLKILGDGPRELMEQRLQAHAEISRELKAEVLRDWYVAPGVCEERNRDGDYDRMNKNAAYLRASGKAVC